MTLVSDIAGTIFALVAAGLLVLLVAALYAIAIVFSAYFATQGVVWALRSSGVIP